MLATSTYGELSRSLILDMQTTTPEMSVTISITDHNLYASTNYQYGLQRIFEI